MEDKEVLTSKEEKMTEPSGLPPGFMDLPLDTSVRYAGQSEKAKNLAKAAMARRLYSVEDTKNVDAVPGVDTTDSKSDLELNKPEASDNPGGGQEKSENKTQNSSPETAPDKPEDVQKPLIEHKEEAGDSGEDDGNKTFCCLTIKTKPSTKLDWPPRFQIKDIVLAFIGFFTFAVDYGTDIRLLVFYYYENRLTHLYLTAGFIIVPSVISGIISVIWYKMYYRRDKRNKYEHAKTLYIFRITLSFFQLGRLWRQGEYIYYVAHSLRLEKHGKNDKACTLRKRATEEKRDATILGLIDGFLESALQLLLQIFIAANSQSSVTEFPILSSLMSSWVSTSLIITTYYRANRKAQKAKSNVDYVSSLFYLLWRMFELGPRYILLGLCAAYFKPWSFIVAALHVIFVTLLYRFMKAELAGICEDPTEETPDARSAENGDAGQDENQTEAQKSGSKGCGVPMLQHAFLLVLGFIGLFSFINLKEGKTRYLTFIYYVVYYAENMVMVALIIWLADDRFPPPDCYVLVVAPIGIVGHVVCAGIFYLLFHPETSGKRRIVAPRVKINCSCLHQN
ncbi:XK-related protein 6-like [Saccostrea echinata]|uniref:XK-related protein 6-like n=1 Tax=Saccostrea echinata TaxID=191078 RepID=UPI002A83CA1D|nr:XK-related protein 6-like [Saccostrea echinata]